MPRSQPKHSGQPSQRQLRVGELVRHALSDVLTRGEVRDPELEGAIVTISEVRMSPDLRVATVLVTPLGDQDGAAVVRALSRNARFLRGRIAPALKQIKFMPELRFRFDTRFAETSRIDELLRSPGVARDLEGGGEEEPE